MQARIQHKSPPDGQGTFPQRGQRDIPCPDCDLRGALTRTVLAPKHDRDAQRRRAARAGKHLAHPPVSVVDYCETCGGSGRVPRPRPIRRKGESDRDYELRAFADPYEAPAVPRKST